MFQKMKVDEVDGYNTKYDSTKSLALFHSNKKMWNNFW